MADDWDESRKYIEGMMTTEARATKPEPHCTNCGHVRSEHSEEMPYECMSCTNEFPPSMCDCDGFSYVTRQQIEAEAEWTEPRWEGEA